LDKPSVVTSSLIQTLLWKDSNAKKITTAESGVMKGALLRFIQLIGAKLLFDEYQWKINSHTHEVTL